MLQTLLAILTLVNMMYCGDTKPQGFPTDFAIIVDRTFTGEAGLCVFVPCYFTGPQNIITPPFEKNWFKGDPQNPDAEIPCFDTNSYYPDGDQCNFELKNLVQGESDGEYRFKLQWGHNKTYIFPETVNITVTELTQTPVINIPPLTVGQEAKVSCKVPGTCEQPLAEVTWTGIENGTILRQAFGVIGREETFSILLFNPEPEHHNTRVTCTVIFNGNIRTEASAVLKVTYAPRILNTSHCCLWGDELACVCISYGFPSPQINWPVWGSASGYYSVTASGQNRSVSALSVSDFRQLNRTVECVSVNKMGETRMKIQVRSFVENHRVSGNLSTPWIVCIFSVAGNIFSAAVAVFYFQRKRERNTSKSDKHVYMTTMKRKESLYETINTCSDAS